MVRQIKIRTRLITDIVVVSTQSVKVQMYMLKNIHHFIRPYTRKHVLPVTYRT